jgi:hypothetical protein
MESKEHKIITAYLQHLEATQPQYGPLLVSTVEAVGPPPAVDSDGSIRTISESLHYWTAVGFTRSYASAMADHMATDAWLKYGDAESEKDEATMVSELARARFWKSVSEWLKEIDPLPMRPATDPAWLTDALSA